MYKPGSSVKFGVARAPGGAGMPAHLHIYSILILFKVFYFTKGVPFLKAVALTSATRLFAASDTSMM